MANVWKWSAGLTALVFDLAIAAIAEYAPIGGRLLGRACGRLVACAKVLIYA